MRPVTDYVMRRLQASLSRGATPTGIAVLPVDHMMLGFEIEAASFVVEDVPRDWARTRIECCGIPVWPCPSVETWSTTVAPRGAA